MMLAYCDKIADSIRRAMLKRDPDGIIGPVGPLRMDLHPVGGYLQSTKKTMLCWDMNGKAYSITIEEQPMQDIKDKLGVDTIAE